MERYLETQKYHLVLGVKTETEDIFKIDTSELLNRLFKENERLFLLQGSGFNMNSQVKKWINGYKESCINGEPIEETRKRLIDQTISDVAGFYFEYISEQSILPFDLEIIEGITGEKTVFATKYREVLKNLVLPDEREGALLEGIETAIEMIVNSEPNTVVFLTSTGGWSGLKKDGKDINFPDNQTYVYWIDKDGNLKAMTLRTNINLDDSEKLIGIENSVKKNAKERIKDVVRSPIKMTVLEDGYLEVLDLIEKKTGKEFGQLRHEINNRDVYISLASKENSDVGEIVEELKQFMADNIFEINEDNIKMLAFKIGKTILDMKSVVNNRKNKYKKITNVIGYDSDIIKYQILHREVAQLVGCNGGGEILTNSSFNVFAGKDKYGSLEFSCPSCNKTNRRPVNQLISNCQHCGADVRC